MRDLLQTAIIDEIQGECASSLLADNRPSTWDPQPASLVFSYPEGTRYELAVRLHPQALVDSDLCRDDEVLDSMQFSLGDPDWFSAVSRFTHDCIIHDRSKIRILERMGQSLVEQLHQVPQLPPGWTVVHGHPRVERSHVVVETEIRPPFMEIVCGPGVYLQLDLVATDKLEKEAILKHRSQDFWIGGNHTVEQSDWNTLEELFALFSHLPAKILSSLSDQLPPCTDFPFVNLAWSPEVRQALLVLVPLRLAQEAQCRGEVAWYRELIDECLGALQRMPADDTTIVYRLFFQLLLLEMAEPEDRESLSREYHRLGRCLATLRRHDATLPFNPVLAYEKQKRSDSSYLGRKLNGNNGRERDVYSGLGREWLLMAARLEQLIGLMPFGSTSP